MPFPVRLWTTLALTATLVVPAIAHAEGAPVVPGGAPLADDKPIVDAPKVVDAPAINKATNNTNITLSAGGQLSTGNSNSLAGTVSGVFDMRRGYNGFGAAVLGNYAQGAPPGDSAVETTENLQGKLRYDRYLGDRESVFLLTTGRHDPFQGLVFRLNLDPGFKYLLVNTPLTALWAEIGYDFQYDIRESDALVVVDADGNPIAGAPPLPKTADDHAVRLFAGFRHAFNKEVTLSTGLEYLQSVVDSERARLNFDARLAAAVGGGFAVGVGVSVRYDHDPLPGKVDTDTATTVSLIYAFSDVPKPPVCPCPVVLSPPLSLPPPPPPPPAPPADTSPAAPPTSTWMVPPPAPPSPNP